MKKYILFCLLCFGIYELSYAQIYIKGYTGYALSTGNEKLTSYEAINNEKYEFFYLWKMGQGVNLGLSIGYALNKNITFEITGNTLLLSKFNYSRHQLGYTYNPDELYSWKYSGFFGDLEYKNTMFQVSPQVVFKSNPYNQWTFYLKGGPDFMLATHKRTIQRQESLQAIEYSGKINTGLQCSFGAEYKLSKNICAFAELTMVNIRYTFNHGKALQYETDWDDSLFDELNLRMIFNHTGLNVGIKYILW